MKQLLRGDGKKNNPYQATTPVSLENGIEEYLRFRRQLGYRYEQHEYRLKQFSRFMKAGSHEVLTEKLAVKWVRENTASKNSAYLGSSLAMVREFARYYRHLDPRTEVPHSRILPERPRRGQPYIYKIAEIEALLEHCNQLSFREGYHPRMRRLNYFTLFGLIAITGMRHAEALALDDEDIDLKAGIIRVKKGKFGKARLLPIHQSTVKILRDYRRVRNAVYPKNSSKSFFMSDQRTRISKWSTRAAYCELMIKGGLRSEDDRYGPRIHDLRHSFAVRTMIRWYGNRENVAARLPYLSTYLGHVKPSCTYWYLSAVPELVGFAAERLEEKRTSEGAGLVRNKTASVVLTSFAKRGRFYRKSRGAV